MVMLKVLCLVACVAAALGDPLHSKDIVNAGVKDERSDARPTINPEERTAAFWNAQAQASVKQRAARSAGKGKARNVVMFMGDGMSVPTLAAARIHLGQSLGKTGEEHQLAFEKFPTVGLTKTYCVDEQIPDSACTATAFLAGVKSNVFTLGMTAAVPHRDCAASVDAANHLETIAHWALEDGRDVGFVTTTRVTHASPAALYARAADRNWENDQAVRDDNFSTDDCPDIAHQLIKSHPGNKFKVILGGGRRQFLPASVSDPEASVFGLRQDEQNLIQDWQDQKKEINASHAYVYNREQLMAVAESPPEYLLGLFTPDHMGYHLEANKEKEPTLAEMTEIAIRSLSRNEKGFFLFVEGGLIDQAHHDNTVVLALDETIELSKAVDAATRLLPEEESLVVTTADHAHVMAFNGYSGRGRSVLGTSVMTDRVGRVPFMVLSYTNGPGAKERRHADGTRVDVTQDADFLSARWRTHADVPLREETHGGDDVAVFARGPHHDVFSGLFEQSYLPHLMAYAGCFGPGLHACETEAQKVEGNGASALGTSFNFALIALVAVLHGRHHF